MSTSSPILDYEYGWCELRTSRPVDSGHKPEVEQVWNNRFGEWRPAPRPAYPAVECRIFYGLGVGEYAFDPIGGKQLFAVNVATGEYAKWSIFDKECQPVRRLLRADPSGSDILKVQWNKAVEIVTREQKQSIRVSTSETWVEWKEQVWSQYPDHLLWLQENMSNTRFVLKAWRPTEHDELRAYINMWKNIEKLNQIIIGAKECGVITDVPFLKSLVTRFLEVR